MTESTVETKPTMIPRMSWGDTPISAFPGRHFGRQAQHPNGLFWEVNFPCLSGAVGLIFAHSGK
ncbi:hypothetical protein [Amycolatopsis vastitatis]|uniref:hypothetical protein n=1 Tax=Amycolatopsis vastitatis TaxID=1905142 RepID=UPI001177AD2D|nr:hypothetical protein [Amycolatopsis vastitatis]